MCHESTEDHAPEEDASENGQEVADIHSHNRDHPVPVSVFSPALIITVHLQ